jgi:uncharacterized protein (DUF2132 family)
MSDDNPFKYNPLVGVGTEQVLTELVEHYGWEILAAYLNINCFKKKPTIKSSAKFLKKTDWAREKVEAFYMYKLKGLPKASDSQFELPPRERIVPEHTPKPPAELSLEDAERLRLKKAETSRERNNRGGAGRSKGRSSDNATNSGKVDPWANCR